MAMPSVEKLLDIGIALSSEKNGDKLLETIVDAAMDIADCDGGTLYVLENDALRFKIMITKSLGVRKGSGEEIDLPPVALNRNSVSACAVLDKAPINIPDIYESGLYNIAGPKEFDARTGYKTVSMLTVPMEDEHSDAIGVLQLVNAGAASGKIIPFAPKYERVIFSLASQAAICLVGMRRAREVSDLLDSFVRVMSTAIDARSPYNANHTRNMARYAGKFIAWLNDSGIADLDEIQEKQFLMTIWLHDIGKLVVPLDIMNKGSRLGPKLTGVMHRFQVIELQNRLNYSEGSIDKEEHDRRADELRSARELVERANKVGFLPDETLASIRALGKKKAHAPEGPVPYLSEDELNSLLVQKGTLTDHEREVMESHVTMTRRMLDEMSFPKRYMSIPGWASSHHEFLNGDGYPDKLAGAAIPIAVRALTILDIYDALTARDRPYKPAVPPENAFFLLDDMAAAGQIDAELLELFKRSEAWKE